MHLNRGSRAKVFRLLRSCPEYLARYKRKLAVVVLPFFYIFVALAPLLPFRSETLNDDNAEYAAKDNRGVSYTVYKVLMQLTAYWSRVIRFPNLPLRSGVAIAAGLQHTSLQSTEALQYDNLQSTISSFSVINSYKLS